MKLSVSIVNYNQKYFPRLCIEAIGKSKTDFDHEIIVCDNASKDESLEYLKKASGEGVIKLIEPGKNVGFGKANNLNAEKAKGKFFLILNTDITVDEDTLKKMVEFLEENPDVGMAACKLVYHNGEVQKSCRRNFRFLDLFIKRSFLKSIWPFKKRYQKYIMEDFDHDSTQQVDLVTGAFMMMPMEFYREIGGFDERYFLFMEDFDLCKKVWKAGKKVVYFPETKAVHYHKRLSEGSFWRLMFRKVSWYHLVSAIKYHWKWR